MFKPSFPFVTFSPRLRKIVAGLVFWLWNALCLSLVLFGFVPHVLPELLRETNRGLIPWSMTLAAFALVALPLLSTVWGIRNARQPIRQLAFFYGLEVPLVLFCLFRIFLVRELTAGLALVLLAFVVACLAFAVELHRATSARRWEGGVRLGAQTVAGLTSLYLGVVLAFYVPVVAVVLVKGFFAFTWARTLLEVLAHGGVLLGLCAVLFALSATLFLAAPVALMVLHVRSFLRVLRAVAGLLGRTATIATVSATVLVVVALFVLLNRQPQQSVFALLAQPPQTDQDRDRRLASAEAIREGLLAAYLAPYRFLSGTAENTHLESLYGNVLGLPEGAAAIVAGAQKVLLAPLLYDGTSLAADGTRAEQLYAEFFDTPLQRRERTSILRALAATWNRDERAAGLLNQDQRQVKLTQQELQVREEGGTATVEIHDVYVNQTYDTQEIFLAFSMPEGAAVTGLWLGDSDDRDERYAFRVAPRGAAQKVYRGEVRRGADPALVEQTGPGQYRLRAFPIPAKSRETERAPVLHLWLTYTALPEGDRWPTPHLVERRNVYWDATTVRRLGERTHREAQDEWVGWELPAASRVSEASRSAVLPGGYLVRRERREVARLAPQGQRLAVVVDRSYSMNEVQEELRSSLAEVARLGRHNDVDIYLTSAASRGEPAERIDDPGTALGRRWLGYGAGNLKQWLRQLEDLRGDTVYDGIFVLSDGDSFDSADDSLPPATLGAPVWIVHLGGRLAAGYDDRMIELISRSRGGATTSLADAIHRFAARSGDDTIINVERDHVWILDRTAAAATPIDDFGRLAARQLILAVGRGLGGSPVGLDEVHRIAIAYQEVSVFSSMIVLVDERQRQALAAAEEQSDRFEREVEPGREVLQKPTNPLAFGATPEPHEWVLIALAVATALVALRQRRRAPSCR